MTTFRSPPNCWSPRKTTDKLCGRRFMISRRVFELNLGKRHVPHAKNVCCLLIRSGFRYFQRTGFVSSPRVTLHLLIDRSVGKMQLNCLVVMEDITEGLQWSATGSTHAGRFLLWIGLTLFDTFGRHNWLHSTHIPLRTKRLHKNQSN